MWSPYSDLPPNYYDLLTDAWTDDPFPHAQYALLPR